MHNALTIDLEDWYHPELVRNRLFALFEGNSTEASRSAGLHIGHLAPQIQQSAQTLLDLLHKHETKATFFVVGEVAQRHPKLIETIAAQGHELACHGMSHKPLWRLTADEFRSELCAYAALMREIAPGAEVIGFRAPTFSLDNRTRWALGILAELGYHYDSSIFPIRNPLYGVNGCPLTPYRPSVDNVAVADAGGALVEFPMSVWVWGCLKVPVCGGFYLRALPFGLIQSCLRQINRQQPFVIYVHPWEVYPHTPRLPLPVVSRFLTYYNLESMFGRLETLIGEFSFAPMRTVLEETGNLP